MNCHFFPTSPHTDKAATDAIETQECLNVRHERNKSLNTLTLLWCSFHQPADSWPLSVLFRNFPNQLHDTVSWGYTKILPRLGFTPSRTSTMRRKSPSVEFSSACNISIHSLARLYSVRFGGGNFLVFLEDCHSVHETLLYSIKYFNKDKTR